MLNGSCHCGAVQWQFKKPVEFATACNCTICRRYGALWAYDFEAEGITLEGLTQHYVRPGRDGIGFHFCVQCGCVVGWRALHPEADGRRRIAVNLRTAEPEAVVDLPMKRFNGLGGGEQLPSDNHHVADVWF